MAMMKEFKEFAMKGNVVDLAVGVIIGGAFGKIVAWDSLSRSAGPVPVRLILPDRCFSVRSSAESRGFHAAA